MASRGVPEGAPLVARSTGQPDESHVDVPLGALVGRLLRREAAAVHAVVDLLVHPRVDVVDLGALVRRVEVDAAAEARLPGEGVEHAHDVAALVRDDEAGLQVDQQRRGAPALELAPLRAVVVDFAQVGCAAERVRVGGGEAPG